MTPARFSLQALVVLVLVALVSWPEQREIGAGAFVHVPGAVAVRGDGIDARGRRPGGRMVIGYGSASEAVIGASAASALHRKLYARDAEGRLRPVPQGVLALGGKVNGILGYARSARNAAVPLAPLVLRNLKSGGIEARAVSGDEGRFTFLDVLPGAYVVEMLDDKGGVLATSDVVIIAVNELRQTTVRASGRQVFASFGAGLNPTAEESVTAAAGQGVARVAAPERCASPPCANTLR